MIANRVRELSEQTKEAVAAGKEQSEVLLPAIAKLDQETLEFLESIDRINTATSALAASSQEISAQTEMVDQVVNNMTEKMNKLV